MRPIPEVDVFGLGVQVKGVTRVSGGTVTFLEDLVTLGIKALLELGFVDSTAGGIGEISHPDPMLTPLVGPRSQLVPGVVGMGFEVGYFFSVGIVPNIGVLLSLLSVVSHGRIMTVEVAVFHIVNLGEATNVGGGLRRNANAG